MPVKTCSFSEDFFCEKDSVDPIYVFETLHSVLSQSKAFNEKHKPILLKYIKSFLEFENFPCEIQPKTEENLDDL